MSRNANRLEATAPLIQLFGGCITSPAGRILFKDLSLSLGHERVALVGRNGVGKTTLLETLAGEHSLQSGKLIHHGKCILVRQLLPTSTAETMSQGELRKKLLTEAKDSDADLLLLDEPTEHLDEAGVDWLRNWIGEWNGGLLVASHDPRLLADFQDFFITSETGCSTFSGTFEALRTELEQAHESAERQYLRALNRLSEREEHITHIARRRARKKQYGRVRELGRATPRQRLNQKRDYAQVKHGRMKNIREERREIARGWAKAARRAVAVNTPLEVLVPQFDDNQNGTILRATDLKAEAGGRTLFENLSFEISRERLAITGPNGSGKTTLLKILLGQQAPDHGSVWADYANIGSIAQGGVDWMLDESLLSYLSTQCNLSSLEHAAEIVRAQKFPLALAERPLKSLSPGERVRAALICLFQRRPAPRLLILDEPTFSLDLVGQAALARTLRIWPGAFIVTSHQRNFIRTVGATSSLILDPKDSN